MRHDRVKERLIRQVADNKCDIRRNRGTMPCAEIVKDHDGMACIAQGKDNMAANETGAPCDKVMHRIFPVVLHCDMNLCGRDMPVGPCLWLLFANDRAVATVA
ncbi:hypothetical protein GHA01_11890 [Novacetimonas hansenii]|uniref:Uncharacterized protein n=1 Tax=Novacetimonas hansenii TaxID=436 RepID=A0ABQ0SDJ0_NOVHA|nr:hypothetical protein Gaha_0237_010 [Novacetimonas hansenii JCM 7643]GBQ56669.1 hypothetical protein AA0243_1269 [Novacetimonas hansenii NRIC 0243]GEC63340.1 hypothetical protein GHA01_11890 [Novacetimonas hansenii]